MLKRLETLLENEYLRIFIPEDFLIAAEFVYDLIDKPSLGVENAWDVFIVMKSVFKIFAN